RLKQNLGFSGGSNIGIKKALEHGAEFTLLLNNDTIVTKNFLSELVNASQTPEAYRIIGGKIFYHRSGNTLWYKGGYISKLTGGGIHREKGRRENGVPKAGVFPVTFVTGCMCLIHKSVFKEIGLLDTSYFLYCEDTDFCMRAGKRGIPMAVNPASIIYHKERSTKNGWQPDHIYYLVRNRILFMQRFKGPHSFLPLFYIFLLLIGALPALLWALSGRTNLLKASVCGFMDGIQKITGPRDLPQRKRPG
ncbi:MAG: glycosyltransferase family 2 protein, partial [Nitrospinota bacterium]